MAVLGNVSPITSEYSEVARRALDAGQCALIVVDIQEKLLPPIVQKEQLLKNSQLLIRLAGILKIPTLMSTQYAKGLGETRSEEHTSELQSRFDLVCRLLLEKKKIKTWLLLS